MHVVPGVLYRPMLAAWKGRDALDDVWNPTVCCTQNCDLVLFNGNFQVGCTP